MNKIWDCRKYLDKKHFHIDPVTLFVVFGATLILSLFYILSRPTPHIEPVIVYRKIISNKEIVYADRSRKQIVLTFDGGAGAQSGSKILDALQKNNLRSTFFLTGEFVRNNPDLVKRMVADGHEIFNHTYNHPYMTQINDYQIVKELDLMDKELFQLTGVHSKPYFRPPYGDRDDRVREVAQKNGYQSVFWTVDALDWQESMGETSWSVKYRILNTLEPGAIYLLHIGDNITGDILDELIHEIIERGYAINPLGVSLAE